MLLHAVGKPGVKNRDRLIALRGGIARSDGLFDLSYRHALSGCRLPRSAAKYLVGSELREFMSLVITHDLANPMMISTLSPVSADLTRRRAYVRNTSCSLSSMAVTPVAPG